MVLIMTGWGVLLGFVLGMTLWAFADTIAQGDIWGKASPHFMLYSDPAIIATLVVFVMLLVFTIRYEFQKKKEPYK